MIRRTFAFVMLLLTTSLSAAPATLTVYTYESFTGEWGPGPALKQSFERECQCVVNWVTTDDAAALLSRLRLEGKSSKADVVVGLDQSLIAEARAAKLFVPSTIKRPKWHADIKTWSDDTFVPFDHGIFAIMHDTSKLKTPPKSLHDLIDNPAFDKKLLIEDPRTSTPGVGLLAWINAVYGSKSADALKHLHTKVLTAPKSWSDAYGLFMKGEAPLVMSYVTSEAYHRENDKTDRYRALVFPEGHPMQIELAAVALTSHQPDLANRFLAHLLIPDSQAKIASKNWMYPAIAGKVALPATYKNIPQRITSLPDEASFLANRKARVQDWVDSFTK